MSKELTLGEKRVRTNFNVSGDNTVDYIKIETAVLINHMEEVRKNKTVEDKAEFNRLISLSQTAFEEAAMWAVKAATL